MAKTSCPECDGLGLVEVCTGCGLGVDQCPCSAALDCESPDTEERPCAACSRETVAPAKRERDRGNGRYKHSGGHDRLCVCGHRLGAHSAERVDGHQPCFDDDGCDCQAFKATKAVR